ncbi:hypothetical protein AZI86_05675 [Bdellovibrio bacteriovorus]|uniref:RDD domain-containing protein n=1 Tax=Bdellovibrio bacteriovorus TaxID=959 RepID=A0A150WQC9_BDEBC|nr:RDD family protein [Bdellovibrio bacteriovorus]KYG66534.1 hypothetical protein AZI86_05675 [Bdellovibrio bacteriovorus]
MSHPVELASKTQRSFARLVGFVTDNPWVNVMILISGIASMRHQPFQGFIFAAMGAGLVYGYYHFGKMGTSISKALFGLQVVSAETGKPVGLGKMFFRDFVVVSMAWMYVAYFGLLLMAIFQPSTARNRTEERIEDAQRAVATAAAVGSATAIFKSGALFKHDNWFKTTVVKKPLSAIKTEFLEDSSAPSKLEGMSRAS